MPTLGELFEKHNISANVGPQSSPRAKLLAQADKMLDMLTKYEDESFLIMSVWRSPVGETVS